MRIPALAPLAPLALLAVSAAGLAACSTATPQQIAAREAREAALVPAAVPTGPARACIQTQNIRQSRVRNDSVIDFEMNNGEVLRNTLPNSCPRLGFEQRFAYRTQIGQLCNVDIITVLSVPPGPQGPACGLGMFQPVRLTGDADGAQ